MEEIKTIEDAIFFLVNQSQISVELRNKDKWRVFDEDMNFSIKDDKGLIEYANEQKEALEEGLNEKKN